MKPYITKPLKWRTVHIELTKDVGNLQTGKRIEIIKALNYYHENSDLNESQRLDWKLVDTEENADLVIEVADHHPSLCFSGIGGSCLTKSDYRNQYKIVLNDLDNNVIGWYVAAMLAPVIYGKDNVPEKFQASADYNTRSRGWK